jgi:hypothetical protein
MDTKTSGWLNVGADRHGIASDAPGSASVRLPATLVCPVRRPTSGRPGACRGSPAAFACITGYSGEARLVRTVAGRIRAVTATADLELSVESNDVDAYVDRAGCGGKER